MNADELISSGLIEMYCLGLASKDETILVEKFASQHQHVRDEIVAVKEALQKYLAASEKSPNVRLRNKILDAVKQPDEVFLPPRLTLQSTSEEWITYLKKNNIHPPDNFEPVHFLDLPGNDKQVTYVVWATKGVYLEESHDNEDEYLLMLRGKCSITLEGKMSMYSSGDVIFIPKNHLHRAEAMSDDMILVGQRIAA